MNLKGGMGNQMFQYALGRKLELKYGVPMYLDHTLLNRRDFGPDFTYRNYDLDIFNVQAKKLNEHCKIDIIVNEPLLTFSTEVSDIFSHMPADKTVFIDGYWQCERYFNEIREVLDREFTFRDIILSGKEYKMLKDIKESNSILINVRRTDYLYRDFYGVMGVNYVERCVKIILEKVEQPKFFIFSDDIDWCNHNLRVGNSVIVDHSYAGEKFKTYFQLMTNCRHFIIPNSTFAWWAAWLGRDSDKIVIAPRKWFAHDIPTDIIYDEMNWIRV